RPAYNRATMQYRVQLDIYNGPLDLLLYLIRREEVDIYDIPIARITEQYCQYVELLKAIDPNAAGEFLVMAATLMLIKSQTLLPAPPADQSDAEPFDPRAELVRQLLQYKQFKDASRSLGLAAQVQALRFGRLPSDQSARSRHEVELEDLQLWDLLTAFNRLMQQVGHTDVSHQVVYDDTPVALHAADILDRLSREGSLSFLAIFAGRSRAEMIGLFLALLELILQQRVRVEQQGLFGPIYIHLLDPRPIVLADELPPPQSPQQQ
ncbi:MAG: segregation and condensation protein A, partial [Phycisphaerae bacterium]